MCTATDPTCPLRVPQRGDRVTVDGYEGIAFWVVGHPHMEYEPWDFKNQDPDTDFEQLVVVMIGDDRRHTVGIDDVALIPEDEHVCSCGQLGCGHQ